MKIKTTLCTALLLPFVTIAAPKNIIYMIGDGMGPAYTTAYRYYMDNPETKVVDPTVFDSMLKGMAHTYPDDHTYVTDSAAGATALATGTKSYNGAIAVDTQKHDLTTMLEIAKHLGKTTALVATSQINHATPASFAAHNESRRNYDEIANDYIDNKIDGKLAVDLMLGGGTKYFIRKDRNIVNEFKEAGYVYADDFNKLNDIKSLPALGLFAEVAFPSAIDANPNRLEKMTTKALSLLDKQNEKGFFIMIEGSQIDWCGHANDVACAMHEMHDFANAITVAKRYVDNNPDTLLVITADHSTGGLTLGANGEYKWLTDVVRGVKASAVTITEALLKTDDIAKTWTAYSDISLSKEDLAALETAKKESDKALNKAIKNIINTASFTGWTTGGHTAVDVQVFAHGNSAMDFVGSQNNTAIADKLIGYIKQ
ncbi:alkaline phosphatase [Pseudoalteromonas xiamenensis]|uniref:Alkaline phosphatase n=1 Tax=Pseudoalteromonas xiamenensis TaxID=882626 RepID=A0A975DK69_9GAMM|nr:alkaline phosphatase [Pseudoalteromonas xiamenensis]QTH73154.1 alkaline phosphatase [Pseudoalteromonas xiamenensis]